MSADQITATIDIIQSLMLPLLAGMLAVQAVFMRQMSRRLFETEIQLTAMKHALGLEIAVNPVKPK